MSYLKYNQAQIFQKGYIFVMYLVYDKPAKDANGYGFPDDSGG